MNGHIRTCENRAELEAVGGSSLKESNGDCARDTIGVPGDIKSRSGWNLLVLSGNRDCVEAGSLRKN
jgi:hypothetical protein